MTTTQLQEFARMGAEARLKAIADERATILQAFPDLGDGRAPGRRASLSGRKRRRMSAAERNAVGKRMKAYWAKRRAKKGETAKKTARKAKRREGMSAEVRKAQGERMRAYWAAKRAQRVDGAGEGTRSETASQNGAATSKRGGKAARKGNK
jgi:hypothetical protein